MPSIPRRSFFPIAIVFASLAPLEAQCPLQLLPGDGVPGANGEVRCAMQWDPDGAGPLPSRLVIAGNFTLIGTTLANRIAVQDPATGIWAPLGSGMNGPVQAVVGLPNGDLVASGQFETAGGTAARWLARWNGSAWSAMNGQFMYFSLNASFGVHALAVLQNGDLVIGGEFFDPATGIYSLMKWNGSTWSGLGTGISGATWTVNSLAVLGNGDLAVGGAFTAAGGVAANHVARWDGVNWSALGSGLDGGVHAMAVLTGGDLVVGGWFTAAGGLAAGGVARWNGIAWAALGAGTSGGPSGPYVAAIAELGNGDLVVGGNFAAAGGVPCASIARWNGASWSPLGSAVAGSTATVRSLFPLASGDLLVGGAFLFAGTITASNLARWDGVTWWATSSGTDGPVLVLRTLANGDVLAGGMFTKLGGVAAAHVARWQNGVWVPLGAGVDGMVSAAVEMPNGDVVVAGQFASAGGIPANNIARWNGSTWAPLGAGMGGSAAIFPYVAALAVLQNGNLVAGGRFTTAGATSANHIARWDGTSWSAMGAGVTAGFLLLPQVASLLTLPSGELVVGGVFTQAGGVTANFVARWNGGVWSAMGSGWGNGAGSGFVAALLGQANGDVIAAGSFSTFGFNGSWVQRWSGGTWTNLSGLTGTTVNALMQLPDGDVLAGGTSLQAPGVPANSVVRLSGSTWSAMPGAGGFDGGVYALSLDAVGILRAGGGFAGVGGAASTSLATFTSTCAPTVASNGAGCTGSAGVNQLASTSLPWIGASWDTRATGMPGNGLVLRVLGFSTVSVPLVAILPQGGPGCTLFVSPDFVDVHLAVGGAVSTSLAIPDSMALVGLVVRAQVAALELDALGAIVNFTASNALAATIGAL